MMPDEITPEMMELHEENHQRLIENAREEDFPFEDDDLEEKQADDTDEEEGFVGKPLPMEFRLILEAALQENQ